jgi:hypothetical protein
MLQGARPVSTVVCESCGARLTLPEGLAGAACMCPRCGAVFDAPAASARLTTSPPPPAPQNVAGAAPAGARLSGCRALDLVLGKE